MRGVFHAHPNRPFCCRRTETTGLDPAVDKVVDISLVEVAGGRIRPIFSALVNPERDIPPTASAVHHITVKDVADKPKLPDIWPTVRDHIRDSVLVAHNAEFDRSMLPDTGCPWICSFRLGRHLWPHAPAHSNQVLRYWLGLEIDGKKAHSAAEDTLVTAHVFARELAYYQTHVAKTDEVEELIRYAHPSQ